MVSLQVLATWPPRFPGAFSSVAVQNAGGQALLQLPPLLLGAWPSVLLPPWWRLQPAPPLCVRPALCCAAAALGVLWSQTAWRRLLPVQQH